MMTIMDLNEILTTPAALAGFATICAALFSGYLSLIEYYCRKAFYDFFLIPDYARTGMRKVFSPDYLLYGIVCTVGFFSVWSIIPWSEWSPILIVLLGALALGIIAAMLFYIFLWGAKSITNGWSSPDYIAGGILFGMYASSTWVVTACMFLVLQSVLSLGPNEDIRLSFLLCIMACCAVIPLMVYRWAKVTVPYWHRTIETIESASFCSKSPQNERLGVLSSNEKMLYCVPVVIKNRDKGEVVIKADKAIIIPSSRVLNVSILHFGSPEYEGIPPIFQSSPFEKLIKRIVPQQKHL